MPNIRLAPFYIDDLTLAIIDRLRDRMSRQEFFQRLIQSGWCNTLEELAKLGRDYAVPEMAQKTGNMQQGRTLLVIEPARDDDEPDHEDHDHAPPTAARR